MQSTHLIRKAIKAVDAEIAKYSKTRATLAGLISTTKNGNNVVPITGRRTMSAAARRRIGDAQRLRWAKTKRKKAA
jgi:chorismate mutase